MPSRAANAIVSTNPCRSSLPLQLLQQPEQQGLVVGRAGEVTLSGEVAKLGELEGFGRGEVIDTLLDDEALGGGEGHRRVDLDPATQRVEHVGETVAGRDEHEVGGDPHQLLDRPHDDREPLAPLHALLQGDVDPARTQVAVQVDVGVARDADAGRRARPRVDREQLEGVGVAGGRRLVRWGVGAQHQHPHDVAPRVVPLGLLDLRQAQRGRPDAGARYDDRQHQHDRQQPESQPDDLPRAPHDVASAGRASLSSRSTSYPNTCHPSSV